MAQQLASPQPAPPSHSNSARLGALPERIRQLQENKFDAVVVVTGGEGMGKSSLGIMLAEAVDRNFDIGSRVVFTNKELRSLIHRLPERSAIVVDEAILTSWKHEWAAKEQRETNKLLTLCRASGHCVIYVLPSLFDLNTYLRDHRVRINIYIPIRGLAFIYTRPPLTGLEDPWRRRLWQKFGDKWRPGMSPGELLRSLRRIPGWTGEFRYPPLPPAKEAAYRAHRDRHLSSEEEARRTGRTDRDGLWLKVLASLIEAAEKEGVPTSRLAARAGIPENVLDYWRRQSAEIATG